VAVSPNTHAIDKKWGTKSSPRRCSLSDGISADRQIPQYSNHNTLKTLTSTDHSAKIGSCTD